MASYFHPHRCGILSRYWLMLVLLLTLFGILSACGASSTAGPAHPAGSSNIWYTKEERNHSQNDKIGRLA